MAQSNFPHDREAKPVTNDVGTAFLVQPGAAIATLSRSGAVKARFGIDPTRARELAAGSPIEVHPGDGTPPFVVPITSISPVAHTQTRLASVLIQIPAQQGLAAGQPLSARVVTRTSNAAVIVSYAALSMMAGSRSFS